MPTGSCRRRSPMWMAVPRAAGTISVFNGVEPIIETFADLGEESVAVGKWLTGRIDEGVPADNIGVFVRANGQLKCGRNAGKAAGAAAVELSDKVETT